MKRKFLSLFMVTFLVSAPSLTIHAASESVAASMEEIVTESTEEALSTEDFTLPKVEEINSDGNIIVLDGSTEEKAQEEADFFNKMFQDMQDAYDAIPDEEIGYETVVIGQETIVDEEAWTETIEHSAETHFVEHEAETHEVEHPAETHTEDEDIVNEDGSLIYSHGRENKADGELHPAYPGSPLYYWRNETPKDYEKRTGKPYRPGMNLGYVAIDKDSKTVVDKEAWTETIVDKEAWIETIVDKEAWTETIEHEAKTHQEDITEERVLREDQDITGPAIIFVPKEEEEFEIEWPEIEDDPIIDEPTNPDDPPVVIPDDEDKKDDPKVEEPTTKDDEKDNPKVEEPTDKENENTDKPKDNEEKKDAEAPIVAPPDQPSGPSNPGSCNPNPPAADTPNNSNNIDTSTPQINTPSDDVVIIEDEDVPLSNGDKNVKISRAPKTGDPGYLHWVILMFVSGIGLIICSLFGFKKENGAK